MTDRQPVILVTPTIQDGLVARWYFSELAAEIYAPALSASRNGVQISGSVYLHDLPDEWIADAKRVYEALRADRRDEVRSMATHQRVRLMGGDIEPVGERP